MDAEQKKAYLESEGSKCPFCKSANICGGVTHSAKYYDDYQQEVLCKECGKAWKDIYTLTDVEEIED